MLATTLSGGAGDDILYAEGFRIGDFREGGDNVLYGNDGGDSIWGSTGNDALYGGAGNDHLYPGAGNNVVYGGAGNDYIGGEWEDLDAPRNFSVLRVDAGAGDDSAFGGQGGDSIRGAEGNDTIDAGFGDDWISGGAGNDVLRGSAGDDVVEGNAGNDRVSGGSGQDELSGGSGNDLFLIVFSHAEGLQYEPDSSNDEANDFIRDFTSGEDALQIRYYVEGPDADPSIPGINRPVTFDDLDSNGDGVLDTGDSSIDVTAVAFAGQTAMSLVIDTSRFDFDPPLLTRGTITLFGVESLTPIDIDSAPLA